MDREVGGKGKRGEGFAGDGGGKGGGKVGEGGSARPPRMAPFGNKLFLNRWFMILLKGLVISP